MGKVANPKGGGANYYFGNFFSENCMKMKKIEPIGEGARPRCSPPLGSANDLMMTAPKFGKS